MAPLVDALILDLGNVLLFHDNALLFRRLGERAGLSGPEVERRLLGPGWDEANLGLLDEEGIRRQVCGALGVDLPMAEFFPLWSSHFTVHHEVLPLVESLAGRVKLVLLSNTNRLHVRFFEPRLPVLERFDHLLYSCEAGKAKPDPEFFREALRRARVSRPDRSAFFDDVPAYVAAANALGIRGHLFTDAASFARDLDSLGL